ncbi:reverse transcriptase domain-containing protein [Tanacetum coccineum]
MRECTFLGYKVNADGLKVCPDTVEAVLNLASPKRLKDVQKLNGKLASLNRFLSKLAKKSLPFFKTLKKCTKKSDFQSTAESKTAFKQMKKLIAELPMLTAPKEKKELIIYLAAAKEAISAVLMTERDGKQMPIYFVSRALQGPEINYTPMEKLILALILSNPEVTGRLLKWSFELEKYDIHYRPRTSVKGQILADFIMERPEDDPQDTPMEDKEALLDPWILFTDGSLCIDGLGADLIITNPEGMEFTYALRFRFDATNNKAEYEALIAGLRIVEQMGVKNLQANVDSRLVANQVNGTYISKEPGMIKYLEKVKPLTSTLKEFSIKQMPRGENKKADALSKIASTSFAHLSKQVLVKELKEKSIDEKEVLAVVEEEGRTWMTPIHKYLTKEILPGEKKKARAIRRKARRYVVTNGVLYKRSFLGPWLRCVIPLQANYVLREIHEGSCNMHAGPRSVVAKALRLGYYWPTMHTDARNFVKECSGCQVHRPMLRYPQQKVTPITSPWPFYKWGIDIAGPFPEGPDSVYQVRYYLTMENSSGITHLKTGAKSYVSANASLQLSIQTVIPVEIGMPSMRTAEVDMIKNDEALEINLDLLEEKREQAAIQEAKSKAMMEKYYNARVRTTSFKPGDLVYQSNEASHTKDGGKLRPKWEGPYEVMEALGKRAYKLRDRSGNVLPRTWNICYLKKCYVHEM